MRGDDPRVSDDMPTRRWNEGRKARDEGERCKVNRRGAIGPPGDSAAVALAGRVDLDHELLAVPALGTVPVTYPESARSWCCPRARPCSSPAACGWPWPLPWSSPWSRPRSATTSRSRTNSPPVPPWPPCARLRGCRPRSRASAGGEPCGLEQGGAEVAFGPVLQDRGDAAVPALAQLTGGPDHGAGGDADKQAMVAAPSCARTCSAHPRT